MDQFLNQRKEPGMEIILSVINFQHKFSLKLLPPPPKKILLLTVLYIILVSGVKHAPDASEHG